MTDVESKTVTKYRVCFQVVDLLMGLVEDPLKISGKVRNITLCTHDEEFRLEDFEALELRWETDND